MSVRRWADAHGDGVLVTIRRRGKTNQDGEVKGVRFVKGSVGPRHLDAQPGQGAQSSVGAAAPAAKCRYASSACARTPALMPCTTWGVR